MFRVSVMFIHNMYVPRLPHGVCYGTCYTVYALIRPRDVYRVYVRTQYGSWRLYGLSGCSLLNVKGTFIGMSESRRGIINGAETALRLM